MKATKDRRFQQLLFFVYGFKVLDLVNLNTQEGFAKVLYLYCKCCLLLGWEYTVDTSVASYVAVEKTYHLSRRRRWVRGRNLLKQEDKVHLFSVGIYSICSINRLPSNKRPPESPKLNKRPSHPLQINNIFVIAQREVRGASLVF